MTYVCIRLYSEAIDLKTIRDDNVKRLYTFVLAFGNFAFLCIFQEWRAFGNFAFLYLPAFVITLYVELLEL